MSKNNKQLIRLIEVLENAGEKDSPPVRAIATVATAVSVIMKNDSLKSKGKDK